MKNKIVGGVSIILIAIASVLAFRSIGEISARVDDKNTYITMSVNSRDTLAKIRVIFQDEHNKTYTKESIIKQVGNSLHSFVYPEVEELNSIRFEFIGVSNVRLNGVDVSMGEFSCSLNPQQLQAGLIVNDKHVHFDKNQLKLSTKDREVIKVQLKDKIVKNGQHFSLKLGIFSGVILLVFLSFILYNRRKSYGSFVRGFFLSAIISIATFFVLDSLKEDLTNITLRLNQNGLSKGETCEVYYAPTIGFTPDRILTDTLLKDTQSTLKYVFPDFLNRYVRIDFPVNRMITLNSIELDHWLDIEQLKGWSIAQNFDLMNDVEIVSHTDTKLVIKTGSIDPYFILSNGELQNKITFSQLKKWDYPSWFSFILFGILVLALSAKTHVKERFFISVFLVFILIPITTMFLKRDVVVLAKENRLAYQKPTFKGHILNSTPEEATHYLEDQFGGRSGFTTTWNILRILAFNQASKSGPVIIGKEGWMFYVGDDVREVFENKTPLTEKQLKQMTKVLNERDAWLKSMGIKYYLVIPPLKKTMYPEYLPARLFLHYKMSKLDQFLSYVKTHSTATVIDLRIALRKAKKKERFPLYYKYDTHWNLLGGYYGYEEVMAYIRKDFPMISKTARKNDYNWNVSTNTEGDLVKLLSINTWFRRTEIVPVPKNGYKASEIPSLQYPSYDSPHPIVTYSNGTQNSLKLIMNRDSYSNFLIPFMSEHFSRSIYLWTPKFNAEIIKQEMPDIVISEMLERFIKDLSIENPQIVHDELKTLKY